MENEIWKPAPNFPSYEVSTLGRVRRIGKTKALAGSLSTTGYPSHSLREDGKQYQVSAHRIIAAAFLGLMPKKIEVNHINGIRTDNRVENLELVTRRENFLHAANILKSMGGFHPGTGSKHHQAKLTEQDVVDLRQMFANGVNPKVIAAHFNIGRPSIYPIVKRKTWRHVP